MNENEIKHKFSDLKHQFIFFYARKTLIYIDFRVTFCLVLLTPIYCGSDSYNDVERDLRGQKRKRNRTGVRTKQSNQV